MKSLNPEEEIKQFHSARPYHWLDIGWFIYLAEAIDGKGVYLMETIEVNIFSFTVANVVIDNAGDDKDTITNPRHNHLKKAA